MSFQHFLRLTYDNMNVHFQKYENNKKTIVSTLMLSRHKTETSVTLILCLNKKKQYWNLTEAVYSLLIYYKIEKWISNNKLKELTGPEQ